MKHFFSFFFFVKQIKGFICWNGLLNFSIKFEKKKVIRNDDDKKWYSIIYNEE